MSEPSPAEEPRDSLEKKNHSNLFGNIVWHIKKFQEFRLVNYRRLILDVMTEGDNSNNNDNNNKKKKIIIIIIITTIIIIVMFLCADFKSQCAYMSLIK